MILPFSTKFKDGTQTYFIEKIWCGLLKYTPLFGLNEYENLFLNKFGYCWNFEDENAIIPKLHTIREDKNNRWHTGSLIHPVVFNRSKNQFQFAPVFSCISTQKIEIKYTNDPNAIVFWTSHSGGFSLSVDGRFVDHNTACQIAENDGFKTVDWFFKWFNHDFSGKIIHWTDLKY